MFLHTLNSTYSKNNLFLLLSQTHQLSINQCKKKEQTILKSPYPSSLHLCDMTDVFRPSFTYYFFKG